ncbi:hypothetical protein lerEdw1_018366 [Lerista edwardsae]|nr:hypothetical protein lerEdw1_018366 [Lerista edwardsae]
MDLRPTVTGQISEENSQFDLQRSALDMSTKAGSKRPAAVTSESSNHTMVSEVPQERPNGRASSGVKQWNKRWFVLVDRCLFYYKDEKEENILGSIPLLSFRVAAVQPSDNISRKYTFKVTVCCWIDETPGSNKKSLSPQAEHAGIRTYFFSAENNEEQDSWIQAMGEAARVQIPPAQRHEKTDSENIPPIKSHQHHHHRSVPTREPAKAEPEAKTRGEGDGRGSEKIDRKPERIENKKDLLVKTNGIASQEMPSEPGSPYPEAPRVPAGVERATQPNGWQYTSPSRPGSMAYPQHDGEPAMSRRSFAPRTNPEKIAQRKSSMTQLQQWVNLRRGAPPPEDLHSPTRFYPVPRRVPDYYPPYSPQYSEDYQYYPPGVRPDSICSMPAYERVSPQWTVDEKRHSFRNSGSYQLREWKDQPGYGRPDVPVWIPGPTRQPVFYDEMDAASGSLRRMSLQPRSRSVPRSPSQGSYSRARVYSPVRSPSARFERMPPRSEEIYAEPTAYVMRRSVSSPKYDYLGDRRPVPAGVFPFNYPASPTVHDKMMSESETLISMVNRMVESSSPRAQLYMQVSHFPEAYRETLHTYKISEQDTDKLLGKLCEQNKVMREQERLVQQLRAEKESLESALMGTHQELEMFGSQPAYPEKLLHKKESLQNQLINIRVELSQASTALANSTIEYENLEGEVSALHDDLWEQLNLDIQIGQSGAENCHVTEKRGAVNLGPSGTYSSNSPASPLSSASLTSPLSPFSLVSGSQSSPTKQGSNEEPGPPRPPLPKSYVPLESPPTVPPLPTESRLWPYPNSPSWQQSSEAKRGQSKSSYEQSKKEHLRTPPAAEAGLLQTRQEQEADKQVALNKVGIVPPRTKSPMDEDTTSGVVRRSASNLANGLNSRDRPKSAVFSNEMKAKMSVEEQIDRMKRHQSGSMKEKRRSLQLPAHSQQTDSPLSKPPASYKVVRRHRSIHEVDISDLEAALRFEDSGRMYESPQEEIARLRKMELEPEHYDVDISKEVYDITLSYKVLIPERYIELEPDTPLSPEEMKEKQKKVERIKTLIAKSSMQNVVPLNEREVDMPQDPESQLQEQEKRIEISCALAAEASRRGRMLSAQALAAVNAVKFHGATF